LTVTLTFRAKIYSSVVICALGHSLLNIDSWMMNININITADIMHAIFETNS